MIFFSFGGKDIRFLGLKCLRRFTDVKKWHDGYIEVIADYGERVDLLELLSQNFRISQKGVQWYAEKSQKGVFLLLLKSQKSDMIFFVLSEEEQDEA